MEPWRKRVQAERDGLSEQLGKLRVFLANEDVLARLPDKQVALLIGQSWMMTGYLDFLDRRLA